MLGKTERLNSEYFLKAIENDLAKTIQRFDIRSSY
jgi:hypothetical protein